MYELARARAPIGHAVVRQVSTVCSINQNPMIEGDPAHAGLILPYLEDVRRGGDAIPLNLFERHTDHLITAETPTTLPMAERVAAHLIAVREMITAHSGA